MSKNSKYYSGLSCFKCDYQSYQFKTNRYFGNIYSRYVYAKDDVEAIQMAVLKESGDKFLLNVKLLPNI